MHQLWLILAWSFTCSKIFAVLQYFMYSKESCSLGFEFCSLESLSTLAIFVLFRLPNIFRLRFLCINHHGLFPVFDFSPSFYRLWVLYVHFVLFLSFFGGQISRTMAKRTFLLATLGHFWPLWAISVHFGPLLFFSVVEWVVLNLSYLT